MLEMERPSGAASLSSLRTHPAFRSSASVIPLSGFSGAHVGLVQGFPSGGTKLVRKAAVSPDHNKRLQEQARLQSSLINSIGDVVRVPQVLDEGYAENCYWFDMEFVPGIDAIEYLAIGSRDRVGRFVSQIEELWKAQARCLTNGEAKVDLNISVQSKLEEIDAKTCGEFSALLDLIRSALGRSTASLSPTLAHGDLTLENILIDRSEKIWLIDSIPSPLEHYWIDISKLFQDLEGRWFLHRERSLSLGACCMLCDTLRTHIVRAHPDYLEFHPVLLALTFARILPYCRGNNDIAFVEGRIKLALQSQMTSLPR